MVLVHYALGSAFFEFAGDADSSSDELGIGHMAGTLWERQNYSSEMEALVNPYL